MSALTPAHPSPMFYAELPCAPELRQWIAAHWVFRVAPDAGTIEHRIPLTGGAIVSVGGDAPAMVTGPRANPLKTSVRGGDLFWGTHLWPWATEPLFGAPVGLTGRILPLAEALPGSATAALERALAPSPSAPEAVAILDRWWAGATSRAAAVDPAVERAGRRIIDSLGREPIARVAVHAAISPRQLRRRFRRATGLSPKELARIRRTRSTAVDLADPSDGGWAGRAADYGFADQAHLAREYRSLFGTSPTEAERHLRRIEHGRLLP